MRLSSTLYSSVLLAVLSMGFIAPDVWAQANSGFDPKDEFLENIRTGEPTTADDKSFDERIDTEINRLNAAGNGTDLVARDGARVFVSRFMEQYDNSNNTISFKLKLAERAGLKFVEQFNRGADLNPIAVRAMATVLSKMASVSARDALLLGLQSTDQVVRYLCAKGLAAIIDGISADARLTQVTLDAIAEAANKESNHVVAAAMYEAIRYDNDHTPKVLAALLIILDGRLEQMRTSLQAVDAAEITAIQFISELNGLSNDDKVAIVGRLAVLLRLSVEAYEDAESQGSEAESRRDSLEQMIVLLEELIEAMVSPGGKKPDIRGEMSKHEKGSPSVVPAMKIELLLWIGTEQTEGTLNKAPWSVPVGAP